MGYKYQGFGAGPTTPMMWVGIISFLIVAMALYGLMAWMMIENPPQ